MTYAEIGIAVGGVLSLALAVFHCAFYRYFNWAREFQKMGSVNSALFYTLNLFLTFLLLFFAYISFFHQQELVSGAGLARTTIIFYATFWLFRAVWQMAYFNSKRVKATPTTLKFKSFMVLWFLLLSASYYAPIVFPTS